MKEIKFLINFLLVFGILWALGFTVFILAVFNFHYNKTGQTETLNAVVLTGEAQRLSTAFDLLKKDQIGTLFISGVHKDVNINTIIETFDLNEEIMKCCVVLGKKARTTLQNAEEIEMWIQEKSLKKPIYFITSSYHMPRALFEIKYHLVGYPITIIPYTTGMGERKYILKRLLSEYHKISLRIFVTKVSKWF